MRDRIRSYLKITVISMTLLTLSTYAFFEAKNLIKGPGIVISYPTNGATVEKKIINVSGKAENASYIYMNGRPVFTDSNGNFSEKIILSKGYNSISMKVEDRIGKEIQKTIEIIMSEKTTSTTTKDSLAKETAKEVSNL